MMIASGRSNPRSKRNLRMDYRGPFRMTLFNVKITCLRNILGR